MKYIFCNAFLINSIQNGKSFWYYNHKIYSLNPEETHGAWLGKHGKEFGLIVPPLTNNDDWSVEWEQAMRDTMALGMIRIQIFNSIATITVADFSKKSIDGIFDMLSDCPERFTDCNWIEVVTLNWEMYYSEMEDEEQEKYKADNYLCAESLNELMEKLDETL